MRPTLTIATFDVDRTGWALPPQFGVTVSELLADRLVESGRFRVMDQRWLEETDPRTRLPFGVLVERARQAGVDYLVVGSVTRYTTERTQKSMGFLGLPAVLGGRRQQSESVMALTVRIVDVRTGELVTTATAQGEASRSQGSGGLLTVAGRRFGAGGFSTSVTESREALMDEALQDAIGAIAETLVRAAAKLTRTGPQG